MVDSNHIIVYSITKLTSWADVRTFANAGYVRDNSRNEASSTITPQHQATTNRCIRMMIDDSEEMANECSTPQTLAIIEGKDKKISCQEVSFLRKNSLIDNGDYDVVVVDDDDEASARFSNNSTNEEDDADVKMHDKEGQDSHCAMDISNHQPVPFSTVHRSKTAAADAAYPKMKHPKMKQAPSAPKRFRSAFIFFSSAMQKKVRSQRGDLGNTQKVGCV